MDNDKIVTAGQKRLFEFLDEELVKNDLQSKQIKENVARCFHSSLQKATNHHIQHVRELKLTEGSREVYKTVSWHVWFLAQSLHELYGCAIAGCAVRAGLSTLNEFLRIEAPNDACLDQATLRLVETLILNELEPMEDHGIAKNGIYIAFKAAKAMKSAKDFTPQPLQSSNH